MDRDSDTGFSGFHVHPMYDDFTTPTFDGKHNLIKGGSWISTGNEATLHARYAFRRHFYQHAGFRVVESSTPLVLENNEYETDPEVANSCENSWGNTFDAKENFHKKLASYIIDFRKGCIKEGVQSKRTTRVLDLNADTGRLAFELAPYVDEITAIDFSARFIRMPIQLQEKGFMRYIIKDENDLVLYRELVLAETGLGVDKEKILFMQDNANNLKPIYTGYDLIIAPNLLEELANPVVFLQQIHERVNPGGCLILASTYDWDMNAINQENRPGGFKRDGEPVTSLEGIKAILEENFIFDRDPINLPYTLRKSSRSFETRLSEVTIWRKRR